MKELFSLQDLFNQRLFRIPDYQRGYSWTEQQLTEFWEDIINLPLDRDHYTGMISLRKLKREETKDWTEELWLLNNWGYDAYHVVDGQQRLTTFIILMNEVIKFYKNLPENSEKGYENIFINSLPLSEIMKSYLCIVKPDSEGQLKTYKFGYEVDNPSYEFFKYRILEADTPGDIQETFYTLNLEKAKDFFANILQETYEQYGIGEIEKLFIKLTQRLKFNIYNIDDDFNVFIAFETMNNRGKRLSNLELLKNRLIYLTTLFNNEDDVKTSTRNKINDTWKTVYGCLGKNKQKSLNDDEFLQAHWIIYFGYSRNKKDSYSDFLLKQYFTQKRILEKVKYEDQIVELTSENIDESFIEEPIEENTTVVEKSIKDKLTIGDVGNYIDSMKNLIPYWYDMAFPSQSAFSNEIKVWLDRINRLGFVYFKPLTTVVLSKKDITDEDKVKYLKAVERFIFMHFRLAGYFSTYKNSFFYNLANSLYKGEKDIKYVINELNNIDYLGKDNILNINSVLNSILRLFRNYKGYYSWSTIRYFLYEYETYLMDNQANQKIYPEDIFKKDEKDKVSIEHIYPQTPTDSYWITRFDGYTDEQKNCLTGSLGNLLPLSLSINIKLQNDSFDEKKRERYYKGSHCEIEVSHYEEWTPEAILEHGKKMLDFMAERWNFKFNNEYDKVKLLALDFMEEEPIDYTDEIPHDDTQTSNIQRSSVITREIVEKVYDISKQVYEGKITEQEAINIMSEAGMNSSSAVMYIYCFDRMMKGEVYKRGTSAFAAEYYISRIREDYGRDYSKKAIESLEKHVQYMKSKNFTNKSLEDALEAQKEFEELI